MRPENVKNVPPPKTRKTGLLMFCMFIIYGAVVAFAGTGMLSDFFILKNGIEDLKYRVEDLKSIEADLTEEIKRMQDREKVYSTGLSIMNEELPTIEIFEAIDKSILKGVILNKLSFTQKAIRLDGAANTENNISAFANNMMNSNDVFRDVQQPTMNRANMGLEGITYAITFAPKPIGESGRR